MKSKMNKGWMKCKFLVTISLNCNSQVLGYFTKYVDSWDLFERCGTNMKRINFLCPLYVIEGCVLLVVQGNILLIL